MPGDIITKSVRDTKVEDTVDRIDYLEGHIVE